MEAGAAMRYAFITISLVFGLTLSAADAPQPCGEFRETLSGQIEGRCHGETPLAPTVVAPGTSRVITIDRATAISLARAIIAADQQSNATDQVIQVRGQQADIIQLFAALHRALGGAVEQRITPTR